MLTCHRILKGSTAHPLIFRLGTIADPLQPILGATASVMISKNGAAFAAPKGAITEIGLGWYKLTPTSDDTSTTGTLVIRATASLAGISESLYEVTNFDIDATPVSTDSSGRVSIQPGSFNVNVASYSVGMSPAEQVKVASDSNGNMILSAAALKAIVVYTDPNGKTLSLLDAMNALITRPASHSNVAGTFPRTVNVAGPIIGPSGGKGTWNIQVTEDRTTTATYNPQG